MAEEDLCPQLTPPRNSAGNRVSLNSSEKAVPRYLRASTGSCHDLCKFGHRHASEEKAKRPFPRRVAAKPSDSLISVDSVASLGRKKSSSTVAKVKASIDPPNMTRSLDRMSFVREERSKTPLAKLKAEVPAEKPEVSMKKERSSSVKRPNSVNLKSASAKLMSSPDSSGDIKIGKKAVISRVASTKVSPKPSLPVASLNKKNKSSTKVVSRPLKDVKEAESAKPENDEVEEKTLYVIKTETEGDSLDMDRIESCAREIECVVEMEKGNNALEWNHSEVEYVDKIETEDNGVFEADQNECSVQEIEHVHQIGIKENGAFEFDQTEHCTREIEYVDKIETEDNTTFKSDLSKPCDVQVELSDHPSSLPSLPNKNGDEEEEEEDIEEYEYTMSEYEDDTYSDNSEAETTQKSDNKTHKGSGKVQAEDEDEKAWKMKFRRGTVVEIKPEDNAPRRLRFRRGRVLDGQDEGADGARRRRFKRRGSGDNDGAENGAEKVVLKHQDVQGKRDAQGLFNNVIEETASKLVEARKSKVKALVGAFETVISLQDGKPSSNATAS